MLAPSPRQTPRLTIRTAIYRAIQTHGDVVQAIGNSVASAITECLDDQKLVGRRRTKAEASLRRVAREEFDKIRAARMKAATPRK